MSKEQKEKLLKLIKELKNEPQPNYFRKQTDKEIKEMRQYWGIS